MRIALVFDKQVAYWREVLHGILMFARTQPRWVLHTVARLDPSRMELLRIWQPAGVIANVTSQQMESDLLTLKTPTLNISSVIESDRLPRVTVDHEQIGRQVAEHFINRGLQNFAYFGSNDHDAALQRSGFESEIARAGLNATLHRPPPFPALNMSKAWTTSDQVLAEWLQSLPKPLGLMLSDDEWGLWITQVCRQGSLRVPEDIAIVGVNDDELFCDLAIPNLSSVGVPRVRIGQSAATQLQTLIRGESLSEARTLLAPLGVTTRHSSSVLAVKDPDVAEAVRYIERASVEPLSVEDVLRHVPVARRLLEKKFRDVLGRTPLQEIRRAHVDRAKQLLINTDLKLELVADRSGFGTMFHLCRVFKKVTGCTPMEFRRQFRVDR